MDLMSIRRRLLTQDANKCPYITDGLVLWMDGIKKGNITGAWVDQIAGHIFQGVSNPVFGADYVATNQSDDSYLINDTFSVYSSNESTIELAISDHTDATQLVFMPKTSAGGIAFGLYNNIGVIWSSDSRQSIVTATGIKTASVRRGLAVVNGLSATMSGGNVWGGGNEYNYIGRRLLGNIYTGKIHAIRVYGRQLNESEMLHNQKVDNKRFSLGLSI